MQIIHHSAKGTRWYGSVYRCLNFAFSLKVKWKWKLLTLPLAKLYSSYSLATMIHQLVQKTKTKDKKKKTNRSRNLNTRRVHWNYKQLLDSVFAISGIIKVSVSVIILRLITVTSTLIIPDIAKTESNNCFIIHCFTGNQNKDKQFQHLCPSCLPASERFFP